MADYRPNQLTAYLFELAGRYSTFFEECPVLKAESDPLRQSRLLLCDLTARTIQRGVALLGISVVETMWGGAGVHQDGLPGTHQAWAIECPQGACVWREPLYTQSRTLR